LFEPVLFSSLARDFVAVACFSHTRSGGPASGSAGRTQVLSISCFWQGDGTSFNRSLLPAAFEFQSPGPDFLHRSVPPRSIPSFSCSNPFSAAGCHVLASIFAPSSVLPLVTLPPRQFCRPAPSVASWFSGAALCLRLAWLARPVFAFCSTIWCRKSAPPLVLVSRH
jgi:hypothetical protein